MYAQTADSFGQSSTVRSVFHNQHLQLHVRMPQMESNWSWDNGLRSLIPRLLHYNMAGYSAVIPDVIGGSLGPRPDKELFIRWAQAVTFMPVMQFGYSPWDYDQETTQICRNLTLLRFLNYADSSALDWNKYQPINAPIWWRSPSDRTAHPIDDRE